MKPKVLIFIDWFLPGFRAGGPITSNVNIVEHLRKDFDFYILTRNNDYCEESPYPSVVANQWTTIKPGVKVFYFSPEYLTLKNIKSVAENTGCDHWYINGIYSKYFSLFPLFLSWFYRDTKVTIAARGMLSPHAVAVKMWRKKVFLTFFRSMGFYGKVHFHATNSTEVTEIARQVGRNAGIKIAPNLSRPVNLENNMVSVKEPGVVNLVSLARISHEKNTLGALELLTKCLRYRISLDWYGQPYDQEYMNACNAVILKLPSNIKVTFHDSIPPSEIQKALQTSHFLFLPTHGENFGHAILESLSAGRPVIISDQTPWRNLHGKMIGWDIALDQPQQFIHAIETAAAMDQEDFTRMSKAAVDYAQAFTSDPAVLEANRKLFEK